jgi:hypothetical protein
LESHPRCSKYYASNTSWQGDVEGTGDMVNDVVETLEKAKRRAAMATRPVEEVW